MASEIDPRPEPHYRQIEGAFRYVGQPRQFVGETHEERLRYLRDAALEVLAESAWNDPDVKYALAMISTTIEGIVARGGCTTAERDSIDDAVRIVIDHAAEAMVRAHCRRFTVGALHMDFAQAD